MGVLFWGVAYLEISDLHTHFTQRGGSIFAPSKRIIRAVDGVSLTIEKGEILGLVGESGCGKSTLSRTIMQLIPATSGTIKLAGEDLSGLSGAEVRRRRLDFQMVFQDPYASLNPRMTVFSALAEAIRQRHPQVGGADLEERVAKLMATVGLDASVMRKYPHEFSGGQRQRIAIARAILADPRILLLDEATSALDSESERLVNEALERLMEGRTSLVIAHRLSTVRHADRILVFQQGRIVESGTHDDLLERNGTYRFLVDTQLV
jgi:ABC-type glutathione transport system ATPase component